MEVILIKDMEKLGYANDIVNVKPGYANNYLIPQGYAKHAFLWLLRRNGKICRNGSVFCSGSICFFRCNLRAEPQIVYM